MILIQEILKFKRLQIALIVLKEQQLFQGIKKGDFKGLFSSSTLDLTDTALGSNLNERSKNIKALILLFADLNMVALQKGDVLGDAYEYLIGQFAMESGKKAGEFYTRATRSQGKIKAYAIDIYVYENYISNKSNDRVTP